MNEIYQFYKQFVDKLIVTLGQRPQRGKTVKKAGNGQIAFLCLGPLIQGSKLGTSRNEIGENLQIETRV